LGDGSRQSKSDDTYIPVANALNAPEEEQGPESFGEPEAEH
jgi:hypothetical protein